jgi:hypothetical protein
LVVAPTVEEGELVASGVAMEEQELGEQEVSERAPMVVPLAQVVRQAVV